MNAQPALHPTDQTLFSYGLGKLDDSSAESVNHHLESCPDCRRRVAEMSSDSFLGRLRDAQGRPDSHAPIVSSLAGLSMLDTGAVPSAPPASTLPPGLADHPDYQILRELGRGGMGVVYLAENKLMGRKEVLKVVSSHLVSRRGVLERFLGEIRNAAKLHHPNVVTAYSASRLSESLVLAMEFVEGLDLARMVQAKGPLPVANACAFIGQAALGLQHAHEHGMVHRDIKPSNLMISCDGKRALVKVLDFGLAKLKSESPTDRSLTHDGEMLGTPDFIAPEQIDNARKADIRADIYSLGCTFYYLLTGGPPFQGDSLYEIFQAHHSMEATPLNLARPEVPVEVAAAVSKMMAKEPKRRFQEPREVAQVLKPFFKSGSGEAVGSKPELSQAGRPDAKRATAGAGRMTPQSTANVAPDSPPALNKLAVSRPEPLWSSLIEVGETERSTDAMPAVFPNRRPPWLWPSVAAVVLMLGFVVAWASGVKVKTKDGVIVLENLPEKAEVLVNGDRIDVTWPGGGKPFEITVHPGKRGIEVKKEGFKTFGEEVTIETGGHKAITVRLEPLVAPGPAEKGADTIPANAGNDPKPTTEVAASRSKIDVSEGPGFISLFNGKDLDGWKTHPSQPGNWRVENRILIGSGPTVSHLYTVRDDFKDFHLLVEARYNNGGSGGVLFRSSFGPSLPPDDPKWAAGYEALISSVHSNRNMTGPLYTGVEGDIVWASHDLKHIPPGRWFTLEVVADGDSIAHIVNGKMSAYHADQKRLYPSGRIALQHNPYTVLEFRKIEVRALNRSNQKGPREIGRFVGHENRVSRVAFSPDGHSILSGGNSHERAVHVGGANHVRGNDNTVRLWGMETGRNILTMRAHPWDIRALAFSPDGRYAASSSSWFGLDAKILLVWDLKTGRRIHRFSWSGAPERSFVSAVAFSPDGRLVQAFYNNGAVQAWDLATEQEQSLVKLGGGNFKEDEFFSAVFSADGRRLVTGSQNGTIEMWDSQSGESLQTFLGHTEVVRNLASSADGHLILSGGSDNTVRLWDAASGKELKCLKGDDKDLRCVALSADGRRALSAGLDSTIRLWDLSSGQESYRLEGHTMGVNSVAFSKDGRRAISGSDDRTVRLWQLPE